MKSRNKVHNDQDKESFPLALSVLNLLNGLLCVDLSSLRSHKSRYGEVKTKG